MKCSRLLLVSIVCLGVFPLLAQNVPPQTITQLKTYYPDTTLVDGGKANCIIVYPDEDGYAELAHQVASAIKAATGAEVPIKTAEQYSEADRDTNLICLGQMNNNKLALELYIWHYIACDDWFPGPDGFVVRSCCDPWGTGSNVIMLGGSDPAGVQLAVDYFKTLLGKGGTLTVPRTVKVQFKGTENLEEFAKTIEPYYHDSFIDLKALPYGAEHKMVRAAEEYFLTGRDEYLKCYALMMRRWMDEYYKWTPGRQITTPKYIIPVMILSYDQIEESPLLPDDLKLEMTNLLYDYTSRMSVHSRITQLRHGKLTSTGHHNVSQTVIYGGRYFKQYYPEADFERIDQGIEYVKMGQDTIANSNGFMDNNGGYTRYYPLTAMLLALAMDNHAFFDQGAARKWMEYCLLICDSWAGAFFGATPTSSIAAWYYQDPIYVWFHNWRHKRSEYYPQMIATSITRHLWTYLPKLEERVPEEMAGVRYMTVHETNYEQIKAQGSFVNVPRERTFHQLAMREGFDRDDQYLRLDGINDGIANGGDGNAISWMSDGRPWCFSASSWGGGRSMRYHTTCLVLRDGQMASKRVAFCDLQLASDLPTSGFARSVMHEYNGLDWARNLAWIKGKYWVIFDQLLVREPADYSIFCQWMRVGSSVDEQYRTTTTSHNDSLHLQAAGGSKPLATTITGGATAIRQGVHGQLASGHESTFVNLLYGHPKDAPADYSVKRLSDNMCLVTEPDRQVLLGVAPLGKPDAAIVLGPQMQIKCTMFALAPDEVAVAGLTSFGGEQPMVQADKPIDLAIDFANGLVTVNVPEATDLRIRGLDVSEDAISTAAPTATNIVQLEAREYTLQADIATGPFAAIAAAVGAAIEQAAAMSPPAVKVQRPDYPSKLSRQWQFQVPEGDDVSVRTIESADLDGDGRAELVVGTSDGRVFCLTPGGEQQWDFAADGGINDIAVADFGDGPRILVASDDEYLHCLDAQAQELWKFTGAGIECTNQAPGTYGVGRYVEGDGEMMAIEVADINADGVKEILVGSKTFRHGRNRVFGTLWCLNPAGELQWHLYQSAGTVTSIAAFDDTGDGQMKIAIESGGGTYGVGGYLVDNQGNNLNRQGAGYGERFCDVARAAPDGSYRKVRVDHRIGTAEAFETVEPYEKKWSYQAGGLSAAGPAVADLNGDGIAEVLVGSGGGSLYCLNEGEQPLTWRLNLGEPISAVATGALQAAGVQIVAGTYTGGVHAVSGEGKPLAYTALEAPVTTVAAAQLKAGGAQSLVAATRSGTVTAFALQ